MSVIEQSTIITFLVEKITKGVRKQLRGYVQQTHQEIDMAVRVVDAKVKDFERLVAACSNMKKDWCAVEIMLREHEQNKKLIYEMRIIHEDIKNELMDIKLLRIQLEQKLQGA